MSTRFLAHTCGVLALAASLACTPKPDPSTTESSGTGETSAPSTTGSTTGGSTTGGSTHHHGTSSTATTGHPTTTDHHTTGAPVTTTDPSGTDTGAQCGGGWCAAKEVANVIIYDDHGHELVIPASDVEACLERTYDIQGAAGHAHEVTITPGQFGSIDAGGQLDLESTPAQGHTHQIWSDCE